MTEYKNHLVFNHDNYQSAYLDDLKSARGRAVIQSPFITMRRLQAIGEHIEASLLRGVHYSIFLQKPTDEYRLSEVQLAVKLLCGMGAHVSFRDRIHEKISIFDEDILWDGSLNFLSHSQTSERLNRFQDRRMVADAIAMHHLEVCRVCGYLQNDGNLQKFEHRQLTAVGRSIAGRRKSLGMTQGKLAELANVPPGAVSQIESGKRNASMTTLCRLLRALDMELRTTPSFLVPRIDLLLDPPLKPNRLLGVEDIGGKNTHQVFGMQGIPTSFTT